MIRYDTTYEEVVKRTTHATNAPFIFVKFHLDILDENDQPSLDVLLEACIIVEKTKGWKFVQLMGLDNLAIFRE